MASVKVLSRGLSKLRKKGDNYYSQMRYIKYVRSLPLQDSAILLEANQGLTYNGNMFYLLRELMKPEYNSYQVYFVIREKMIDETRDFLEMHGITRVSLVTMFTDDYYRMVATAKYLVTDVAFLPFFIKREGQVYVNTWHGTPLKTLGKQCATTAHTIGNVQRNFGLADYIVSPNEFTQNHLRDDYMLPNVMTHARLVLEGYPRNEAFFDDEARTRIRREMQWPDDLDVIAYMPTWREYTGFESVQAQAYLIYYLTEIDKMLPDSRVMYVNLHPRAKENIDFEVFTHIKPFPDMYETYEFLNACDCLVTDYSSVMFDYMLTGRPIILFAYDLEHYLLNRGCYFPLEDLQLPIVRTLDELFDAFDHRDAGSYASVAQRFTPYDGLAASRNICHLLLGMPTGIPDDRIQAISDNHKPNVVIYAGNLLRNGITSSLTNLLHGVDTSKCNYYVALDRSMPSPSISILDDLIHSDISFISLVGKMNLTFMQKVAHYLYTSRMIPFWIYWGLLEQAYVNEWNRQFSMMRVDRVVQFTGYGWKRILQFAQFNCPRTIFVHNDMIQEIRTRGNAKRAVLRYAYRDYDYVAMVAEGMCKPTRTIAGDDDNFIVIPNSFDSVSIFDKAQEDLHFDEYTQCNRSFDEVCRILNGNVPRLISVGRFSPEKGHKRLIAAFGESLQQHPDAMLFIVGSRSTPKGGCSYTDLCDYVAQLDYADHIVLIENMSNPYPLIRQCSGFILPSVYEAFPMVIFEADLLGLPVAITDLPGPRDFVISHGGKVVENSEAGVHEAVEYLLSDQCTIMGVDYAQYNEHAVQAFEDMLDLQ